MEIQGKFNKAQIHTDNIDEESIRQIYNMLNNPSFENGKIVIMPDVHFGKGSVVGFTMAFNGYVNPSIIGVDIGCGIDAYKIGKIQLDLSDFDEFVRNKIPSGSRVHENIQQRYFNEIEGLASFIDKVGANESARIMKSIGSLGGGNHFIELDIDQSENIWLIIHSGSRNFGVKVCEYHQKKAREYIKQQFEGAGAYHRMEFISLENGGNEYLRDMETAQEYALQNRLTMAKIIVEDYFKGSISKCEKVGSIHNYINFEDNIIRKGAISAHKGEAVVIPLNMRDGCVIATGKGNEEWNYSSPHGAGRLLRRGESKELLSLEEYKNEMEGIYSSCVDFSTIDESPMAYKNSEEIMGLIGDTVEIDEVIKPIYNFKATN